MQIVDDIRSLRDRQRLVVQLQVVDLASELHITPHLPVAKNHVPVDEST